MGLKVQRSSSKVSYETQIVTFCYEQGCISVPRTILKQIPMLDVDSPFV